MRGSRAGKKPTSGIVNTLAVRLGGDLNAGVAFYGAQPPAEEVPKIKAPLMLHYAGLDTRINAGWPAYEQALKAFIGDPLSQARR